MQLPQPEENYKYLAIDCNHRLKAFQKCSLKTANALVFPPLEPDVYEYIAGIYFFIWFTFKGVANELHDDFCVKVTDWEKFRIFVRCFNDERFKSHKGVNHEAICKHLVSLINCIFSFYLYI